MFVAIRLTLCLRRLVHGAELPLPERPAFEPGELEELLGHLAYEALMFGRTREEWNRAHERHVLEALLLHARNLREFLFGQIENYGRDADKAVLASDYAPNWKSDKGNQNYRVLWDTNRAIDAQLAHLSRRRVDSAAQRELDKLGEEIASAVARAWGLFQVALSHTSWSARLDSAIAKKAAELGL